jgi:hypothetical protein
MKRNTASRRLARTLGERKQLHRWRLRGRVRALRHLAARTQNLRWTQRLLSLTLEELNVDEGFVDLVGRFERLPVRRYPQAIAVAIALRHSWRPDDLSRFTRRLHLPVAKKPRRRSLRTGPSARRRRLGRS